MCQDKLVVNILPGNRMNVLTLWVVKDSADHSDSKEA